MLFSTRDLFLKTLRSTNCAQGLAWEPHRKFGALTKPWNYLTRWVCKVGCCPGTHHHLTGVRQRFVMGWLGLELTTQQEF